MTTARTQAREDLDGGEYHKKTRQSCVSTITSMPETLLERILISGTSIWDKKALRRTCRSFKHILDTSMVCIHMTTAEDGRQHQENFMKRVQQLPSLTDISLYVWKCKPYSLFTHLPTQLSMLDISGDNIDVRELARLPRLTTLCLSGLCGRVTGMGHLSGLTSLYCDKPLDTLTHLAPTLKRLSINKSKDVQGMAHLTNLEVLDVNIGMLVNFFPTHSMLPLKQVAIGPCHDSNFLRSRTLWKSAPPTLTRLTWIDNHRILQDVLPPSITHLQLVRTGPTGLEQAPAALPWLRRLDT